MLGLAQVGPLEETYGILAKFEVVASEEEQKMLADLPQAGEEFKDMLKEVEQASPNPLIVFTFWLGARSSRWISSFQYYVHREVRMGH